MDYKFLTAHGGLSEGVRDRGAHVRENIDVLITGLESRAIASSILELIPEAIAREHTIVPLADDGETITVATADPDDISLADTLRFLLARDIRLVPGPCGFMPGCSSKDV